VIRFRNKLFKIIIFIFFLITSNLYAECNFNTSENIDALQNPSLIKKIKIKIPKSGKFNKNFAKIISLRTENIPPKLRKKFKANIIVEYGFGFCSYQANVRQSGDWKDHVQLNKDTKPFRSLNVKLKNGNIMNAVEFKLLIPETRNNLNEVLGSVILRELGFIAPETFQVQTDINGTDEIMLFQENVRKELLERNLRREGPTFEADESIIWSYGDWENFALSSAALTRVTSSSWFSKGEISQKITLSAFSKLQKAYMESPNKYIVFPNKKTSQLFEDYFFIMLSMNGVHGLADHNRKFYYNSIIEKFEPIYYDGNLKLQKFTRINSDLSKLLNITFHKQYKFSFSEKLNDKIFIKNIFDKFKSRVIKKKDNTKNKFFKSSIAKLQNNLNHLQIKIDEREVYPIYKDHDLNTKQSYIDKVIKTGLVQNYVSSIEIDNRNFKIKLNDKIDKIISSKEIIKLLSKNILNDKRTVFVPSKNYIKELKKKKPQIYKKTIFDGVITYSNGIVINIDPQQKKIILIQSKPNDWVLFNNINVSNWLIEFEGVFQNKNEFATQQRFNENGLTGCLNFYNTKFHKSTLLVNNAGCEDGVNIMNSNGKINSIFVKNARADAIDIDFSNIEISQIDVKHAGNDCLDVSGGNYKVKIATLISCKDKAISIGEKSVFKISVLTINDATTGISTKDFSKVTIKNAKILNAKVCVESLQKKQEFGGGITNLSKMLCDGKYITDNKSLIIKNNL